MDVLFVCRGNVARSQVAQAFYQQLTGKPAHSAGIIARNAGKKIGEIPLARPTVLAMKEYGIDLENCDVKKLSAEEVGNYQHVIVLAEDDIIPPWLREVPHAEFWSVPDPKEQPMRVQREVLENIQKLIKQRFLPQ